VFPAHYLTLYDASSFEHIAELQSVTCH